MEVRIFMRDVALFTKYVPGIVMNIVRLSTLLVNVMSSESPRFAAVGQARSTSIWTLNNQWVRLLSVDDDVGISTAGHCSPCTLVLVLPSLR